MKHRLGMPRRPRAPGPTLETPLAGSTISRARSDCCTGSSSSIQATAACRGTRACGASTGALLRNPRRDKRATATVSEAEVSRRARGCLLRRVRHTLVHRKYCTLEKSCAKSLPMSVSGFRSTPLLTEHCRGCGRASGWRCPKEKPLAPAKQDQPFYHFCFAMQRLKTPM